MVNWSRIKLKLFERITPRYFHGKQLKFLEDDLDKGFLRAYVDDYLDAMLSLNNLPVPKDLPIYLTRDRKANGRFVSGLEQARKFSRWEDGGVIYVFKPGIIDLRGYQDDGQRNILVREPINLHLFLDGVLVNGNKSDAIKGVRGILARKEYLEILVLTFEQAEKAFSTPK